MKEIIQLVIFNPTYFITGLWKKDPMEFPMPEISVNQSAKNKLHH
jgi:hypothetical protein